MKRTLVSLSALTLSLISNPVLAQEIAAVKQRSIVNNVEITPFHLVLRSYQGSFSDQGIPSHRAFTAAVQSGRITAYDLVENAIAFGRLNPETIDDRDYLNNVQSHLTRLIK